MKCVKKCIKFIFNKLNKLNINKQKMWFVDKSNGKSDYFLFITNKFSFHFHKYGVEKEK